MKENRLPAEVLNLMMLMGTLTDLIERSSKHGTKIVIKTREGNEADVTEDFKRVLMWNQKLVEDVYNKYPKEK